MNSKYLTIIGIVAFAIVFAMFNIVFIMDQRQQALVVRLGKPIRAIQEPGLNAKVPFVDSVVYFDRRILDLNTAPEEMTSSDQKRVIIDAFAKYKIIDPLRFYQRVRDEVRVQELVGKDLISSIRQVLNTVPLSALLSEERSNIMRKIKQVVNMQAKDFGIEVLDVRIMRADLPKENSEAIYRRMQTERQREAREERSLGEEEALRIRSRADRDKVGILAEARKQAQIVRGQGDGEAAKIFNDAIGRDPEFYGFYRSMQAYRETLKKDDTKFILTPESEFLRYMKDKNGR